jgi:hypothetical protein
MSEQRNEVAPPGWSGTVKAMKKKKDIDNPFALAWYMKKKGDKPHYPEEKGKGKKKKKKKVKTEGFVSFSEWLSARDR